MSRDFETLYYEQQASHTEARGMLAQERDGYKAKLAAMTEAYENMRAWAQANGLDTAARNQGDARVGRHDGPEPIRAGPESRDAGPG